MTTHSNELLADRVRELRAASRRANAGPRRRTLRSLAAPKAARAKHIRVSWL